MQKRAPEPFDAQTPVDDVHILERAAAVATEGSLIAPLPGAVRRVLVVPTEVFHSLGHFQGFSGDVERYVEATDELASGRGDADRCAGRARYTGTDDRGLDD